MERKPRWANSVARLGKRSDADLEWETNLLLHLEREGLIVPVPLPTTDGRLFVDGLVVMKWREVHPRQNQTGVALLRLSGNFID